MAVWWITEAIPLAATALLPIVLYPLLGIMRGREVPATGLVDTAAAGLRPGEVDIIHPNVADQYMDWIILLFMGGFMIALAVEKWNLHKRIALHILRLIGGEPRRLVLGFMTATGFLSMWLSNTATTLMMLPMGMSLILLYEELNAARVAAGESGGGPRAANFALCLLLGIAYSASIGGLATLVGTPPNGVLVTQLGQLFPAAPPIAFSTWFLFALPISVIYMLLAWWLLTRLVFPLPATTPFSGRDFIRTELRKLGPMSRAERRVAGVFAAAALLWMTRKERLLGAEVDLFGWSHYLDALLLWAGAEPVGAFLDDGTVSIAVALSLYAIPAGVPGAGTMTAGAAVSGMKGAPSEAKGSGRAATPRLLDWEDTKRLPWGILLIFGGGLAIAKGFAISGLSDYIAGLLGNLLGEAQPLVIVASTVAFITGLTEFSSNVATVSLAIPIMSSLSQAIEVHPLLLLIPTTLAASCAFMLPVSTPPNAIVFGSGRVPIRKMVVAGLWLDLLSVVLLTVFVYSLGHLAFGVLGDFPTWAVE